MVPPPLPSLTLPTHTATSILILEPHHKASMCHSPALSGTITSAQELLVPTVIHQLMRLKGLICCSLTSSCAFQHPPRFTFVVLGNSLLCRTAVLSLAALTMRSHCHPPPLSPSPGPTCHLPCPCAGCVWLGEGTPIPERPRCSQRQPLMGGRPCGC